MKASDAEARFANAIGTMTRRSFLRWAGAAGLAATVGLRLAGRAAAADVTGPMSISDLIAGAKKEGLQLHAYGMPPDWANWEGIFAGFNKKYGVSSVYKPEGDLSSAQELQKFEAEKAHPIGDIGDVGFKWGPVAVQRGIVQAYKNAHWADIAANLKDPNGFWVAEYSGVMSFAVNTARAKKVPRTWKELLDPGYKNMIAIDQDPRQAFDAFGAVLSAAYANGGGVANVAPGVEFFAKLKQSGNFIPVKAELASMQTGEAAIAIRWSFLNLADRDAVKAKGGPSYEVVIPSDGAVASPYVSVINKWAPHPMSARLFQEYLFSDEGQLGLMQGYATPVRAGKLKVPADLAAKTPPASALKNVVYLTDLKALDSAQKVVNDQWGPKVMGQ
jgi:putative spermidine/putrescine transport system substrate-binding protein